MDFAHLMAYARVEKDAFCRGCLARINMGHDAYIAITLNWGCSGHDKVLVNSAVSRLPTIVRERFVGFRHTMRIFFFLHGRAAVFSRVK